jgi:hypothetical protein
VLGVDVADLVRNNGQRFFVVEFFQQAREYDNDVFFRTIGERVHERALLHEHLGHVYAERRASDLKFCVKVGELF